MPISETESAYKPIIYGQQTPIGSGQKEPSITLKTMVEFYKERPRESVKGKLAEKQAEVDQAKEKTGPKLDKAKAQEQAI